MIFKERAYPKRSQNLDFSVVSWDFEGMGSPNLFLKLGLFRSFLGILKECAHPKKIKTRTFPWFSWDFEGTDSPKKLVNPQISLDHKPGNHEV
jgi:hypothetical protein